MTASVAPSALLPCFYAQFGQSRGKCDESHRKNVSCSPVKVHLWIGWDGQHHLSNRGRILSTLQKGGRLKSIAYTSCRLQDKISSSVAALRSVSRSSVCVPSSACGQVLRSYAFEDAPLIAHQLYAARPSSQIGFLQSIPPTRLTAEEARKTATSCFRSVTDNVVRGRRTTTAPKNLCKLDPATMCRSCVFGLKTFGKVGSVRSLTARNSAGDGRVTDGLAASGATIEEASTESEWLKVKLKQWLDDEYCPEPANEDISERCKRVYYRCLLEGVDDFGDILVEFIRDLETFNFKESFHGPFTAANAAVALIMERNEIDQEK